MGFTTFYTYYMPSGVQIVIRGIDVLAGQVQGLDHNILIRHGVTDISLTPNFISVIASREETLAAIAHHPINVASTGGRLLPGHYEQLKKIGVAKVFNFYGASEAGLIAFQEIECAEDVGCFENIRAGHTVRIVDENGDELPTGKVGSLSISGGEVYVGTYGAGGHNAQAQSDWHLTGDLAKFDTRGRLVILGRNFRGVRISSSTNFLDGEFLEAALAEHEKVQFASIVALESLGIAPFIGIFVCAADGESFSEHEVIQLFNQHIGNQPLVAEIKAFILGALPMTPRGKVDRMRLIKAAIEYLYSKTLSAAITDESFNLMASDDDELLLAITVGRADKMPMVPPLAQRVHDVLRMSPYRINIF
jgi:acyl-CoA synthetase (AMP-forming)/AMP-acid ligase II